MTRGHQMRPLTMMRTGYGDLERGLSSIDPNFERQLGRDSYIELQPAAAAIRHPT